MTADTAARQEVRETEPNVSYWSALYSYRKLYLYRVQLFYQTKRPGLIPTQKSNAYNNYPLKTILNALQILLQFTFDTQTRRD